MNGALDHGLGWAKGGPVTVRPLFVQQRMLINEKHNFCDYVQGWTEQWTPGLVNLFLQ